MIKNSVLYFLCLVLLAVSSCGNRCVRLDGPREEFFMPLGNTENFTLSAPAEMTIIKDTLTEASLEIAVQPEVMEELEIQTIDTSCEVQMDACFKDQATTLLTARMKRIKSISFSSAGEITSGTLIEEDSITLENSGLGDIDLLLRSDLVTSKSISSGNIILSGETSSLNIIGLGSGETSAFNLFSDTVRIKTIGSGIIEVFANKHLEIEFFNPTTVRYRGNPENIIIEGEGNVVDANL